MAKILIIYSTTDGHTRRICERIKLVAEERDHLVSLAVINDDPDIDLESFDKIVIGASVRYGKHRPELYKFIARNEQELESKPHPGGQGIWPCLQARSAIRPTRFGIVRS